MDKCPICNYRIDMCQCQCGGSGHPDRSKHREAVLDHLYIYTPEYNIAKIANEEDLNEVIETACKAMELLTASLWSRR